jgi:hypothetical protein
MGKKSVAFLTVSARMCDTVHLALITQGVYFYAVTNFANPAPLQDPTLYVTLLISSPVADV